MTRIRIRERGRTFFEEIPSEEYDKMQRRYEELRLSLSTPQGLNTVDVAEAVDLCDALMLDDDMDELRTLQAEAERRQQQATLEASQRVEAVRRGTQRIMSAIESIGKAVYVLRTVKVSPSELAPVVLPKRIDQASLAIAPLESWRVLPEIYHSGCERDSKRLDHLAAILSEGIPADVVESVMPLLKELADRNEKTDAVYVANLQIIDAEAARREEEATRAQKVMQEASDLPATITELQDRISSLEEQLAK